MTMLHKLRWSIQHRGIAGTLRAAANHFGRQAQPSSEQTLHPFDAEHGTDTGGLISGANLASGHPSDRFIEGYAAIPPSRFHNTLARWQQSKPAHAVGEYTFVDLGCGKGRAVLLASRAGFREAIGVELNPGLAATAKANVDRWNAASKELCPVRVEQGDALEFPWPDGPCLIFLYNPFGGAVMQRVLDRLAAAFRDRPSDLEILYCKAEQSQTFAADFDLIWCEAIGISPEDFAADPVADPNDETRAYRLKAK